jgi:hypothetical protein
VLGENERVFDVDGEIAHRALDLGVTRSDQSERPAFIDDGHFLPAAEGVRSTHPLLIVIIKPATIAAAEAPVTPCRPFGSLRDRCPAARDALYRARDFPLPKDTLRDDEPTGTKA